MDVIAYVVISYDCTPNHLSFDVLRGEDPWDWVSDYKRHLTDNVRVFVFDQEACQ